MPKHSLKVSIALLVFSVAILPAVAFAGLQVATGNVREVGPGVFFRTGQLTVSAIDTTVYRRNITTILNLRGAHPEDRWFASESSMAQGYGVKHISVPLSPNKEPSVDEINRIAFNLQTANGPILIHTNIGANRTGLVSAICELAVLGKTPTGASRQLSLPHSDFAWLSSGTAAMDRASERFAAQWGPNTGRVIAQKPAATTAQ